MEAVKTLRLKQSKKQETCYHCGDPCANSGISVGNKCFCCNGCKLVYELLEENNLCQYYDLQTNPGISPKEAGVSTKYKYLEDESVRSKLINFTDGNTSTVTFYIPSMHCASCVWLLESLYKLNPLIVQSKVDFLKKELTVTYEETANSLRQIVELLSSIGYEPEINLDSLQKKVDKDSNRQLYIKIGVAGFAFANIMMFSFPDYLSQQDQVESFLKNFFSYLSFLLALPVLFYSASDYFKSALHGWKQRSINMDVPISLGILALFIRSSFEIFLGHGTGYMDSFTGLVFLLLVGKLFEKKTYDTLSFERDYKSYFPVAVTRKHVDGETSIPLEKLEVGNRIIIRNQELIPADSILIRGQAYIDYSFVTGESAPVEKVSGDLVYAGGRQIGGTIELDVIKDVNQSYLTELWNDESFTKDQSSRVTTLANRISKYFTIIVLSIAGLSGAFWITTDVSLALNAFTAVLIVACPCALALSTPFTLGNTMRIFGWNKFYLKSTSVIESLAKITTIVFDKTGTITHSKESRVEFIPAHRGMKLLENEEKQLTYSLAYQSMHPVSRQIAASLREQPLLEVEQFREIPGMGIEASIKGKQVRLGSYLFTTGKKEKTEFSGATFAHLAIDGNYRGYFRLANVYRSGLKNTLDRLNTNYRISLLTGDNESERENLKHFFGNDARLLFNQSPHDKLAYVKALQKEGERVLMIGDGLNDAGALNQSDVGISVAEDINTFSPASDAIIDSSKLDRLSDFLRFSGKSVRIIIISFVISFIYNLLGLSFAVQGTLSPLIAAVLMPVSSISVILFTTGSTTLLAKKMRLQLNFG
ncbi:MAG TPA: HAD family hydrolase [Caldithrix abyssi]|uniref:HAD family hydrolase n=1 Tax=Caldithrix abyssi TaxID=187145 RepID=A0A7V4TX90_CALAY|nr:HAD family hydrolase [Caldithrix abyssi]